MAAKLCINHLNETHPAIQFAQQALKLGGTNVVKAYHALGLGYSKLSTLVRSNEERKEAQKKALDALQNAYELDRDDYLIAFHLSLQYAEIRDVAKALQYIKLSLSLNSTYSESWNLLALLLSSQKHYADALVTCKTGLQECSDINLLITKAKLEQALGNTTQALLTYKDAFAVWKKTEKQKPQDESESFDDNKSIESSVKDFSETDSVDRKSVLYTHTMSVYSDGPDSDKDSTRVGVGRIDLCYLLLNYLQN